MTAAGTTTPTTTSSSDTLPAAAPPARLGGSTALGLAIALVLLCLGLVAVRDGLVLGGQVGGTAWSRQVVADLDGLSASLAIAVLGGVAVLAGLWCVVTALRPHTSTALALESTTGVVLRPLDLARVSTTAAQRVDGVLSARTTVARRTVTVRLRTTGAHGVDEAVRAAVDDRLSALARPLAVHVASTTAEPSGMQRTSR